MEAGDTVESSPSRQSIFDLSTLEERHPYHQNKQLPKGSDDHFGVEPSDSQQNVVSLGAGPQPRPTSGDNSASDVRTTPTPSSWGVNPLYDEREEKILLSKKLDSSDPISVLVHAKAVYMASDHRRTRDILDVLNRHLDIDPTVLRGKLFGFAITYYREKNYPSSMEYFDELERVSLEHNSPADVAVASIYRGEIHWAQQNYEKAYKMFQQARTTYGQDHVAHLYGIIIVTKSAVTIKAGSCQKNLGDFRKAEELYTEAIRIAIKTKDNAEQLPPSDPQRERTITSSVKDEIASRSYLGNLLHSVGNYQRALDQYKIVLNLQETVTGEESGSVLGLANSNVGVALMGLGHVLESIPYLKKSYELAKKYERSGVKIGQAANSLGNALLANKQHEEAENYFEMALGHSVYYKDDVGQSKYLGSIGNVRLLQGKLPEALRCYTEALSLNSDESCRVTALQNRALVYIKLGTKLTGEEWDEIPEDIEATQPKEIQPAEIPIEESSVHSPSESKRVHLVAPKGSYTPIPLDDASELLRKEVSPPTASTIFSSQVVRSNSSNSIQPPQTENTPAQSDILSLSHKKYYFLKAKEDLKEAIALVEKQFGGLQIEGSITFSLSLFETNAKAYYSLQKVFVLLGDAQSALRVAEQNRARNLGEILWNKKRHNPEIASLSHPLDLPDIFKVVNREQVPLILFSYIKQSSTMLAHIVFPNEGETEEQSFRLARGDMEDEGVSLPGRIPPRNYHFVKLDLSEEFFLNKPYGSTSTSKSEPISFDQYVMKTLMEYINQRETELFTPIDFQDDGTPLTVLFERIARPLVEVIEKRAPKSRELVIVADQAAHFLPWALLQDEWSKVFLGDKYRVRTYPSILTMGVTNHLEEETIVLPSEENFLVVGNPSTPKFSHNGVEVTLGRLPHSEMEAIQIADILETKPIIKELATKSTVRYRLQSAKIIHIATHSSASHGYLAFACNVPVVNTAKPVNAEEALIFIDEIQKMSIHASLVVLSACDSARGQLVNEGVNSVARAFLAAGALSVLVSYVRVPDKSASIFMSLFYRFLSRDGFTTSEAIQKSSMGIRCIKNLSQHVHWGGYQLIGRNIRVQYNRNCATAKVVGFLGFSTPFPRLNLVQEVETAIFRQDRTPPRDVVLVKGMSVYDPAEVVRDFIVKRHNLYPGGIFWYNCSTLEHLRASVALVEKILPRLTSIRRTPPEQPKKTNKKEKNNVSQREAFVNHHKLIVLDTPFDLKACVDAIPALLEQEVDIIVIGNMDYNIGGKVERFIDNNLIRGCVTIEVPHIDIYTSIQRMAYSWLCTHDANPFEEDYEAFDTIANMCLGCATLVRVFEGMLRVEEDDIVQKLANDIEHCKSLVTEYKEVNVPSLPSAAGSSSSHLQRPKEIGKKLQSLVKRPGDEKKKQKQLMQNGLVDSDQAKRLTDEECVLLSEGLEKLPRFSSAWNNFLLHKLTSESHFLLQCLSYITLYPDIESEGPFLFPEGFVLQMAKILSNAEESQSSVDMLSKLRSFNLVLPYPQAIVHPPECHQGFILLQVPNIIARSVTYEIDQADIAFILSVTVATLKDRSNLDPVDLIGFIQSRVSLLIEYNDLHDVLIAQDVL